MTSRFRSFAPHEYARHHHGFEEESKAPVSQLVNADDTSVIEIKTQHYLES